MHSSILFVALAHVAGGIASFLAPRVADKRPDLGFMEVVKRAETTPCASLRCPTVTPVVYNTTGCTIPSCVSTTVVTSALPVPPGVCGVATDPPLTAPGCPDADYLCTKTRYTGLTQCPPIPCTSTYVPTVYSTVTTTIFVTPTDYTYTTFSTTSTSTTSTTTVPPPTSTSSF